MFNVVHWNLYLELLIFVVVGVLLFMGRKGATKALETGLLDTEKVFHTAEPLLSATPLAPAIHVCDEILQAANVAVRYAEQLFSNGTLPAEERKATASAYVVNYLKALGVDVTPRIAEVIDGAIEAGVNLLPPAQKVEAAKSVAEG